MLSEMANVLAPNENNEGDKNQVQSFMDKQEVGLQTEPVEDLLFDVEVRQLHLCFDCQLTMFIAYLPCLSCLQCRVDGPVLRLFRLQPQSTLHQETCSVALRPWNLVEGGARSYRGSSPIPLLLGWSSISQGNRQMMMRKTSASLRSITFHQRHVQLSRKFPTGRTTCVAIFA